MGNKHKRFLTKYTHSKYFTPIIACLCFLAFVSKAGAQSFSVPLLDFYEFGTEVTGQDRATVAYYIKREFGDSLLTLDN